MKIRGSLFLNLLIISLIWYWVDFTFNINYTSTCAKIVYLVMFLVYVFARLWIYSYMAGEQNKYLRPNMLPKFGEGFLPQWPDEKERHRSHNYEKVEIPLVLQFMPLFFIAFVVNKTILAIYRKVRDWSNDYLTIELKKDES